jgi:hypothetical protein
MQQSRAEQDEAVRRDGPIEVTTPDLINGAFEILGSFAVWGNFLAILKDRGYAGTRLPMMAFFTTWSFWNLYFYSHLLQWFSLYASMLLTLGDCAVVSAMMYFGRKK